MERVRVASRNTRAWKIQGNGSLERRESLCVKRAWDSLSHWDWATEERWSRWREEGWWPLNHLGKVGALAKGKESKYRRRDCDLLGNPFHLSPRQGAGRAGSYLPSRAPSHTPGCYNDFSRQYLQNLFWFYITWCFACLCVHVSSTCLVPLETRRGHQNPWTTSRHGVLGIDPGSWKNSQFLNYWPLSKSNLCKM